MSVKIIVSKAMLEEFPQVYYQLFYLSSQEQQAGLFYIYTAKGYYRQLTDVLDEYQIAYNVASSQDLSLLPILIIEKDILLAWGIKDQLEKWGFGKVQITDLAYLFAKRKPVSLAIVDKQSFGILSVGQQLKMSFKLFPAPVILLTYSGNRQSRVYLLLNRCLFLEKPFRAIDLKEAVERLLNIALPPFEKQW